MMLAAASVLGLVMMQMRALVVAKGRPRHITLGAAAGIEILPPPPPCDCSDTAEASPAPPSGPVLSRYALRAGGKSTPLAQCAPEPVAEACDLLEPWETQPLAPGTAALAGHALLAGIDGDLAYSFATRHLIKGMDADFRIKNDPLLYPEADPLGSLRFRSCAVVGSSPTLLGKGLGAEIDAHDAVLRFNNAPTCGWEADVGNRTTIRSIGVAYVGRWDGIQQHAPVTLIPTSSPRYFGAGRYQRAVKLVTDRRAVCPTHRLIFVGETPRSSAEAALGAPPSSGFIGFLAAGAVCERVAVYGFGFSTATDKHHYYSDIVARRKDDPNLGHPTRLLCRAAHHD